MLKHTIFALVYITATSYVYSEVLLPQQIEEQNINNHRIWKRFVRIPDGDQMNEQEELPHYVEPLSYRIQLQPYVNMGHFRGSVLINVTALIETDTIVLLAHQDLQVSNVHLRVIDLNGNDTSGERNDPILVDVAYYKKHSKKPWLEVILTEEMQQNATYELSIDFASRLNTDDATGFFRMPYDDMNSKQKKWYIGLALNSNNAREVFPCFDELKYKTPFQLSVVRKSNVIAVSNMPSLRTVKVPGEEDWVWEEFEETPPLSTFAISLHLFDSSFMSEMKPIKKNGITLRGYARSHLIRSLPANCDGFFKTFTEMEDYFQMKFPISELKVVILPDLPRRHSNGFGVIVASESDLTDMLMKYSLPGEIAEQWFSFLITPVTWEDAIASNGLELIMRYEFIIKVLDKHNNRDMFSWTNIFGLSSFQGLASSTISPFTNTAKQEIWGWVLRMFNATISEATFRQGIQALLKEKIFSTYSQEDLLKILTYQAWNDKTLLEAYSLQEISDSWVKQKGYPLVTVLRNYENQSAIIEQEVFVNVPGEHEKSGYLWWIPIVYITNDNVFEVNPEPAMWIESQREVVMEDLPEENKFIIVNPQNTGLFLVNYDDKNWRLINDYLQSSVKGKSPNLPTETRTKLLHDSIALAMNDKLNITIALETMLSLKHERSIGVWYVVSTLLEDFTRKLYQISQIEEKFLMYMRKLMVPFYDSIRARKSSEKDELHETALTMVKTMACGTGLEVCLDSLRKEFKSRIQSKQYGENDYNNYDWPLIKYGTRDEWELFFSKAVYLAKKPHAEETTDLRTLLRHLAENTIRRDQLDRFLNFLLLDRKFSISEDLVEHVVDNVRDGGTLIRFFSENWNELKNRFYRNRTFENLLSITTKKFVTQDGFNLVSLLFVARRNESQNIREIFEEALKTIEEESEWYKKHIPDIEAWLDTHTNI